MPSLSGLGTKDFLAMIAALTALASAVIGPLGFRLCSEAGVSVISGGKAH